MKRQYFLIYLSPLLLAFLAIALFAELRSQRNDQLSPSETGENSYREAFDLIENEYVEDVSKEDLIYAAIKGMTDALDRHSRGYDPDELREFLTNSEGNDSGIGIRYARIKGGTFITRVIPQSPASRGGLLDGDQILAVDGREVDSQLSSGDLRRWIVGPEGSTSTFRVKAWGQSDEREQLVKRGRYNLEKTSFRMIDGDDRIAYVRVAGFNQRTGREFRDAFRSALKLGAQGLVLDLRGNPGGGVQAAVEVVSAFMKTDVVFRSVSRRESEIYDSFGTPVSSELPAVVLVDGDSASAAEIVAGALQDHKRALVVGARSYGKGLVQNVFELRSRPAGLKITTSRWLTPSGRCIQRGLRDEDGQIGRGGIIPDFPISLSRSEREFVEILWGRERLRPDILAFINSDDSFRKVPTDFVDRQLQGALELLAGRAYASSVALE
ncbi:MAG: S41 family peptidase [Planctomycetota bacterium]